VGSTRSEPSISEAIAERRLTQEGEPVRVEVFAPVARGEDFECRYKIEGLQGAAKPIEHKIVGVDGVQALALALKVLDAELHRANRTATLSFGGDGYVAIF
jgi:hypothetical protein